jgi:hypothetical protein
MADAGGEFILNLLDATFLPTEMNIVSNSRFYYFKGNVTTRIK